ncbi:hypothetical protein Tco_0518150 [Tanacetum coccineum]
MKGSKTSTKISQKVCVQVYKTGGQTGRGGGRTREPRGRVNGQSVKPNDQGVEANKGVNGVPDFSTIIA